MTPRTQYVHFHFQTIPFTFTRGTEMQYITHPKPERTVSCQKMKPGVNSKQGKQSSGPHQSGAKNRLHRSRSPGTTSGYGCGYYSIVALRSRHDKRGT